MGYYQDMKRAAIDLGAWIADDNRVEWAVFCRIARKNYGIGPSRLLSILEEDYPGLTIINGKLTKIQEEP